MAKAIQSIDDITFDPQNANQGTERGRAMVEKSMREAGAARSVVVDANGVVIAGKTATQTWDKVNGKIIVVPTTGEELVVVQRTDLDLMDEGPERTARKLAYFDNQSSSVGLSWNASQIANDLEAKLDLGDMFQGAELSVILDGAADEMVPGNPRPTLDELEEKYGEPKVDDFWPIIRVKVSPEIHARFTALMGSMDGGEEMERFAAILALAEGCG